MAPPVTPPDSGPRPIRHIAVVGGGISGLAAAHRLTELDPRVQITLLEAGGRLGGVLRTTQRDGFSLEASADNFITTVPWAIDLCRRLGLADQLVGTNDAYRQAFVIHKGRLRKIPEGFLIMAPSRIGPILATPILSPLGKLRLAAEYFVKAKRDEQADESLASFVTRRLGREVYERLVQPLVGGIYTADPEKLSVRATMPRFLEMEREHGGLIRAVRKQAAASRGPNGSNSDRESGGVRYSMFMTVRGGLSSLVETIAARLPEGSIRCGAAVRQIARRGEGGWSIHLASQERPLDVDALILAIPSHHAARLLSGIDSRLTTELEEIEHAPCAIVSLGYRRDQIGHRLDGFGFVVPLVEKRKILSGSFSSVKYEGRAPQGHELIRVFIGGACQSELVDLPEQELLEIAKRELADLLSIRGEPVLRAIDRWKQVMPQYHVGHCEKVDRIDARVADLLGLEIAGNAYRGVGMPHCIHAGELAAERVMAIWKE